MAPCRLAFSAIAQKYHCSLLSKHCILFFKISQISRLDQETESGRSCTGCCLVQVSVAGLARFHSCVSATCIPLQLPIAGIGLFPFYAEIQSGWPVTLPRLPGTITLIPRPTTSSRFQSIHVPAPTKSFTFLEGHRNQILKLDVSPSPVLIVPPTTTQSRL